MAASVVSHLFCLFSVRIDFCYVRFPVHVLRVSIPLFAILAYSIVKQAWYYKWQVPNYDLEGQMGRIGCHLIIPLHGYSFTKTCSWESKQSV